MTVVVDNASTLFIRALKEMAKLDGATVSINDYGYYPRKVAKSILRADRKMEKARRSGKLKTYATVDEMFGDL
ncbi:MAG: hypothetical protein IJU95_02810 [Treponema sp.]|nr:hypothetical protein [Treponema sp.]